ncbi:MAG: heme-binding protein [Gammaproteobacteria bacterium]|nr:MAG: heme-binding protein [Gammaproteobacteria bacterium]
MKASSFPLYLVVLGCLLLVTPGAWSDAPPPLVGYRSLSPELAMKLVRRTLEACRRHGYQVGVAVVDRSGLLQAYVRDRYAGPHTIEVAMRKAWTAASFRTDTLSLAQETRAGSPQSGIRWVGQAMMVGGGRPIEADGSLVGALGVSGAPSGALDDQCAREGLAAIEDELNLF